MFGFSKIGLNLKIGTKLGITSGLGVLLLAAILISELFGNSQIREASGNVVRNDNNGLTVVTSKVSVLGMQLGVRDIRLATTVDDVKNGFNSVTERYNSSVKIADWLVQNLRAPAQHDRAEKNRALVEQYFEAAKDFAAVRTETVTLTHFARPGPISRRC